MNYSISGIELKNFKSYNESQLINVSDLTVLLGANSSGKSTALQALLILKQTMECNSQDIELLLSGKYVALGEFDDILYDKSIKHFSITVNFKGDEHNERNTDNDQYSVRWTFAQKGKNVYLSDVDIWYEDKMYSWARIEKNTYCFKVDSEETIIISTIRNMKLNNTFLYRYDTVFNKKFADFLNELIVLFEGKKSRKCPSNKLVSLTPLTNFYFEYLQKTSANLESSDEEKNELARKLVELIEAYRSMQKTEKISFLDMPNTLKEKSMYAMLEKCNDISKVEELIQKYNRILQMYKEKSERDYIELKGKEVIMPFMRMEDEKNTESYIDNYYWVKDFYSDIQDVIARIFFVGPIRENPKGLYSIGFEQEPKYVGPTGQFFASVLYHENKKRNYILPNCRCEKMTLIEALAEWAQHLNIATAINVAHSTSYGISVNVSDTQDKCADIMNVGIGTSQVLPVLITGLLSVEDEILIFEQPELHLHPYSQSRLADFFIALINNGRKIIIETHSETLILRTRYNVLSQKCNSNKVAINFFVNKQGTKVEECNVTELGAISYPSDFKDETQELLNDLITEALRRTKNDGNN